MTLRLPALLCLLVCIAAPAVAQDAIALQLPLDCVPGISCAIQNYVDHDAGPGMRDYACGEATYDGHEGTDFRLATATALNAGVAVRAAARGHVLAARDGMPDDGMRQPGDPGTKGRECGNGVLVDDGGGWETQYCHLQLGSVRVRKGDMVLAGQQLGLVGLSGRTDFPHLHLTVRKDGLAVDPFAFGADPRSCEGGSSLWGGSAAAAMPYVPRLVLNSGFSTRIPSMEAIENGELKDAPPVPGATVLAFYARTLHLREGDTQQLRIDGPDGKVLAESTIPPLERSKAQYLAYAGLKLEAKPLQPGLYRGLYRVVSKGKTVLEHAETFSQ
jgi:murein DD-endopeptidase MepM/ murein hydrolase activator NlpD